MGSSLLKEYINRKLSALDLENELLNLVKLYNKEKKTYLLIYAVDIEKSRMVDITLSMSDYHVIHELLRHHRGTSIDIYLETLGGSGEAAEEIVEFLHNKFETVDFVIAGESKSAGTLMALSADEIYMTDSGSLGPIDAQVKVGRSYVSAFDYVKWIEQKRKEAEESKNLNLVDSTMIAQITPGEFEGVQNAQQFAIDKVKEWLPKYKFKHWKQTETRKIEVTEELKTKQAEKIAKRMMDSEKWRSHARSLKIKDLVDYVGLRINKLEENPKMCDLVYRIKTVIKLLFGSSTHYKMFVIEDEKIFRDSYQPGPKGLSPVKLPIIEVSIDCPKCRKKHNLYVKFGVISNTVESKLRHKAKKFPSNNKLICDCGYQIDLSGLRNEIEKKIEKKTLD
jgi:ClpP class serine protease